jgi:hypothetical protein
VILRLIVRTLSQTCKRGQLTKAKFVMTRLTLRPALLIRLLFLIVIFMVAPDPSIQQPTAIVLRVNG